MRRLGVAVVAILLIAGCADEVDRGTSSVASPTPQMGTSTATGEDPAASVVTVDPSTVPRSTSPTVNPATAEYVESFEFVWATINERYFDPGFGGVDWEGVHDQYLPEITAARTDLDAFLLVNNMLWELGVSHIGLIPADDPGQLNPLLSSEGELGFDVRLLDGEWVITEVKSGSAAAAAGLGVGHVLESIDGQAPDQIATLALSLPPRHERGVLSGKMISVRSALYDEIGVTVRVGYRDSADRSMETDLTFGPRQATAWSSEMLPGVPPAFTIIEVDRKDGDIGYLRFDAFGDGMLAPLLTAIDELQEAPGLIIDLRGNEGGVFDVRKPLIDRLVDEPALIWTYRWRNSQEDVHATPAEVTYDGPLVVLVDVLSASSAEEFAGALQAMGRAYVIGERTAGRVLVADLVEVPNGALMIYPVGQSMTSDGTVLEGHGVIPDLPVAVHRSDLLVGKDPPLQAAIDYLRSAN